MPDLKLVHFGNPLSFWSCTKLGNESQHVLLPKQTIVYVSGCIDCVGTIRFCVNSPDHHVYFTVYVTVFSPSTGTSTGIWIVR
jgi:hypothetical protein